MTTIRELRGPSGRTKSINRSVISELLHSDRLINELLLLADGRIELSTVSWNQHWAPVARAMDVESRALLTSLQGSREEYITSGYRLDQAAPYCRAYFALLPVLLRSGSCDRVLRGLIGLESFVIRRNDDESAVAGGAITVRHPVYLIAKLREPKAYDDPKFLAMIAPCTRPDEPSRLYFHYRQVKVADDPWASMLVHPAVDEANRTGSFASIDAASAALSHRPDPRSKQRAKAITDWAVAPFLKSVLAHTEPDGELRFIDVGGGSGALLSAVCGRLVAEHYELIAGRKFAWSIVDLGLQDASRRANSAELRQCMSFIEYLPSNYQEWLEDPTTIAPEHRAQVLLVCRLFNNMSRFRIEQSCSPDVIGELTRLRGNQSSAPFHPADCLAGVGGRQHLIASNSRVRFVEGSTYRQASLSDYYQGLAVASGRAGLTSGAPAELWYPLRKFNHESLILGDGRSIFGQMCNRADLVVIEDVDLTPEILKVHLERMSATDLMASDATDRVRMQSARLMCVTRKELASHLPGRRIW